MGRYVVATWMHEKGLARYPIPKPVVQVEEKEEQAVMKRESKSTEEVWADSLCSIMEGGIPNEHK